MNIGAERVLRKYGTRLKVAEAFLKGQLNSFDESFLDWLVDDVTLEAARIRIEWEKQNAKAI